MRALVISGGGSKGAFAGGIAEYLIGEAGKDYDIFVGTSTGSILNAMLAVNEIERLKRVYTTVEQEDIFNINPFVITRDGDEYHSRINHWDIFRMFLKGKSTFGESEPLLNLICRTFQKKHHQQIVDSGKKVVTTVSNLTLDIIEYKYANDYTYEEFCKWIWISCNIVPFMSLARVNGYEYADGGFGNLVPIQEAISLGAKEIDVIVLNPRHRDVLRQPLKNPFTTLLRTHEFMLKQIARDDIHIGQLESMHTDIELNIIHTPRALTTNALIFDPVQMKEWWEEGYEYARNLLGAE